MAEVGFEAWHRWRTEWAEERRVDLDGVTIVSGDIVVAGIQVSVPTILRVASLDAAFHLLTRFGHVDVAVRLRRALDAGGKLKETGAIVDAQTIRSLCALPDSDIATALSAVTWLGEHPDLSDWTQRQLPIPGMHSKWVAAHGSLLRQLMGRDIASETRRRPAIVHLTYVDGAYRRTGGRHHDAWTQGDSHQLPYLPERVVVVENRDCRIGFPELERTIVVEGEGKAVGSLVEIDWIRDAAQTVYWGDLDADGFAILDRFRRAMESRGARVQSILMNRDALAQFAHLGVDRSADGRQLLPSRASLGALTHEESRCYALLATQGGVPVRRVEQERIPREFAIAAVRALSGQ